MRRELDNDEVVEALKDCATEPVHIPGAVQPIAVLMASHINSGEVLHASANAADLFCGDTKNVLGKHLQELLGAEIWHTAQNFLAMDNFHQQRLFAGLWSHRDKHYSVHLSKDNDFLIVEIESDKETPGYGPDMLREQNFLIDQIQSCSDEQGLFDLSCRLLRHITGFDRVLIYQFDEQFNGIVRAEARKTTMETFNGLRFPHWDIPKQARDIMARIPLRLICDVNYEPNPIIAQNAGLPPLDITQAQCRAASPIHMQYLRNMGVLASMTLSVVLEGKLWGMISFHHQRPKTSAPQLRQILTSAVLPIFCLKLGLLRHHASENLSRQVDQIQSNIQKQLEQSTNILDLLDTVGPSVCKTLEVDSLAIINGSQNYSFGKIPPQQVLDALITNAGETENGVLAIESLKDDLPSLHDYCDDLAGVFAITKTENQSLLLFRKQTVHSVAWAGNPDKTIEKVEGNNRLAPRGSFHRYLEAVEDRCKAWSEQDQHLIKQLWPLLSAAERQAFMSNLSRQQTLMINELNHRVRNILALVKSVSKGARKGNESLESYCQVIESRIMAIAAAHDLGAGAAKSAVSVKHILAMESDQFNSDDRFVVSGDDFLVRADLAPIMALVLHELTTNAVKHGSLSVAQGKVHIEISVNAEGATLTWAEQNGPSTKEPSSSGFGTVMIKQAVPFELGGTSSIVFNENGLHATISIPRQSMETTSTSTTEVEHYISIDKRELVSDFDAGLIMVLEDNFMIANAMVTELETLGCPSTEMFSSPEDAFDFLESQTPFIALLDINLGQGKTSHSIATELINRGVPIAFISGYGDKSLLPPHLMGIKTLTKPVSSEALQLCLTDLLAQMGETRA